MMNEQNYKILLTDEQFFKSSLDDRKYRAIRLQNDLEALLISDPTTEKASCGMDVGIGYYCDPEELPGLAHFLEHMLFMGTSKYPDETEMNVFMAAHGGSDNAYTVAEHTNYHFTIVAEYLKEALDRFSQYFISPLFHARSLDNEVEAVDSENAKNFQAEDRRILQFQRSTANPKHVMHKFPTGNRFTLKERPTAAGINVRERLIQFYHEYYSANLMKLVVLGKEPLEVLEKMVADKFSLIKNSGRPMPTFAGRIFEEEHLRKKFNIVPIRDHRIISLFWPLPPMQTLYYKSPEKYISHLIGHETAGSILSLLKKRGWGNELMAGTTQKSSAADIFHVKISLTEEGFKHVNDIMAIVFQYIKLVKEKGIQKWIFDEIQAVDNMSWKFKQKSSPYDDAKDLSRDMHFYRLEHVLVGSHILEEFDAKLIADTLSHFSPENLRVFLISREFQSNVNKKEEWYGTEYSEEFLSEELLQKLRRVELNEDLHLPEVNELIPTEFNIKEIKENNPKYPILVRDTPLMKAWYKQDDMFEVPRLDICFNYYTPLVYHSAKHNVMTKLFQDLLQDSLNEYTYFAEQAGLEIELEHGMRDITISCSGFNQKLPVLLKRVFDKMKTFVPSKERFDILKEKNKRAYANIKFAQPHSHTESYWHLIMYQVRWTWWEKLKAIETITFDDLKHFIKDVLSVGTWEILLHGNVTREEIENLLNALEQESTEPLQLSQFPVPRVIQLEKGKEYIHEERLLNDDEKNSAIFNFYQIGPENTRDDILLDLFHQINKTTFFDQLRTKEQMGYIVWNGPRSQAGIQGYRIEVVSPKYDPVYIDQRIEACIDLCEANLKALTPEEFIKQCNVLITKKTEKPKQLKQQTDFFWEEIESQQYQFNRIENEVEFIKKITYQELLEFFEKHIKNKSTRAKISIRQFQKQHWEERKKTGTNKEGAIHIENIYRFKWNMPLWPSTKANL